MKKTRLLEIVREEIASALNEFDTNVSVPINTLLKYAGETSKYEDYGTTGVKDALEFIKALNQLTQDEIDDVEALGQAVNYDEAIVNAARELRGLNEMSQLNEKPNIDGPLDFTLKSPNKPITPDNINQGALQKAIDSAVEAIKKEYPEYNSNKLSNLIMKVNGKKELKADSFSPEILKALKNVKDTIEQQYDVFGDYPEAKAKLTQFIKDYKNDINPAAKDQLEKFASGDKKFTDVMGYNQTETAAEKALGIKPKKAADIISTGSSTEKKSTPAKPKAEKPESTGKKGRPAGSRKATLTPGDDGFDKVTYSDEEVEDTYYNDEDEFTTPGEEGPSSKEIASDKTAKELGNLTTGKEETFNRILGLIAKYKDNKALVDAYISKAENEYKLPASLLKQLKLAAGREVKI